MQDQQKHAEKNACGSLNGGPKGLNVDPNKSHPKSPKLKSGAGLGRASGKKHENMKSVQYLQYFKHIEASQNHHFLQLLDPKLLLERLREGLKNKNLQNAATFLSKISEKNVQKDPDGPSWFQNPYQIDFSPSLEPPSSNFWSRGCLEGGTGPKWNPKSIQNRFHDHEVIENTS